MYSEKEARELVIEAGLRLLKNKLIARTWGNISARVSENEFIITPSGRAYDTLKPEELVKVNMETLKYEGNIKPSSEKGIHAHAYLQRSDVNFVIHTHQYYASAMAAAGKDLPFAPCAGYGLPGTGKLKKAVSVCIANHPNNKAFLMEKHGALCLGNSFEDAFEVAEELERKSNELFHSKVSLRAVSTSFDASVVTEYPFAMFDNDPMSREYSYLGKTLPAYIDDFAQIVGPEAKCRRPKGYKNAIKHRNAVLLNGLGALCVSDCEDDLEAISLIVSKNCAAALFWGKEAAPLNKADALLQRVVYLKKYSKQKDKQV